MTAPQVPTSRTAPTPPAGTPAPGRTARRRTDRDQTARGAGVGRVLAGGVMAAVVALAFGGCSGGTTAEAPGGGGGAGAPAVPAVASEFWSDPSSAAADQVVAWRDAGRADDARELEKIARQPVAIWPTGELGGVEAETRGIVTRAGAAAKTPVLVAYNVPNRDCGQYSSGGAFDAGAYRQWVGNMARGLSGARAVVVLEPDALAQTLTACEGQGNQEGREALLAEAAGTLTRAGGEVYIDAGNPGFVTDIGKLADGLRKSGVSSSAGFALNVSNFQDTARVVAYGKRVSDELGGARFVVDTSRNGNGPYSGPDQPTWCNPPGRALGTPPSRTTADPRVAAYLWIKEPGDSDGDCRGAPEAGKFWPDYALGLARNTPGT